MTEVKFETLNDSTDTPIVLVNMELTSLEDFQEAIEALEQARDKFELISAES